MYGTFHRVVLQPYAQVGYSPFYIMIYYTLVVSDGLFHCWSATLKYQDSLIQIVTPFVKFLDQPQFYLQK